VESIALGKWANRPGFRLCPAFGHQELLESGVAACTAWLQTTSLPTLLAIVQRIRKGFRPYNHEVARQQCLGMIADERAPSL